MCLAQRKNENQIILFGLAPTHGE